MTATTAPGAQTSILIVDDSAVMRSLLRSVIASDPSLAIAGTASDGASALRLLDSLHPDLILLDVEMPIMDGLSTLRHMQSRPRRTPVIMCSSLTRRGAKVTIEALASGAADYVAKPTSQASPEAAIHSLAKELIPKIHALTVPNDHLPGHVPSYASGHISGHLSGHPRQSGADSANLKTLLNFPPVSAPSRQALVPVDFSPQVVLIGVSTGGPAALETLLPKLPASFPLPILIVQHMPELFTKMLAERLDAACRLRVMEAAEGQPIRPGTIYVAKGNWHMEIAAAGPLGTPTLRLTQEALENHCRPAVDVLFRSAVPVYRSRVLAVILTGMGSDGLSGCRLLRDNNGVVLAQDEASSVVWGMPGAVASAGLAQRILPLSGIAAEILRLASRAQSQAISLERTAVSSC